tara:strand:+ start:285 stop:1043 length:759 start_codon:yes stop_codon:yes gene_type:complete
MKKLILCPGIPRSGTTSLWNLLSCNNIIKGSDHKEIHYLSLLHNNADNGDPMYPSELINPQVSYAITENERRGLLYPYNLDNYISYLNSHSNPADFSQSYFLLPQKFLYQVNNKLKDYFDVKIILIYREPIRRLISYIGMLHHDASCFGVNLKNKRDLFMEYINNLKLQSLYKDVKEKYEKVFENVMCLTTEHFFLDQKRQKQLTEFLEVPMINVFSDPQNVRNFNVELSHEDLKLARSKLKDSIDFYENLI